MSINRENYENYENMPKDMKKHVDNMWQLISDYAKENNVQIAYDDRAENLVGDIATYILESQEK